EAAAQARTQRPDGLTVTAPQGWKGNSRDSQQGRSKSIMRKHQIHVSDSEMQVLAFTAAAGNFSGEDLVGAAAWQFAEQDEGYKEHCLREVWFRPPRPLEARPRRQPLREKLYGLARRFLSAFGPDAPGQEPRG